MTAPSGLRALFDQLGDRFEDCRVDERIEILPHLEDSNRVRVKVHLDLAITRDAWGEFANGERPEKPPQRTTVRREDISVQPRYAATYAARGEDQVSVWEATLDGRLSSGERVELAAEASRADAALARLAERIEAEGWQIEETNA